MVKSSASMHRQSVDLTTNHRHSHNFALVRKSLSYQKELPKISSSEDIIQRPQPLVSPEIAASFTDSLQFRYDHNPSDSTMATPIISERTKEKGVYFADQVEETIILFETSSDILSRKDMTQDEVRAYWYSRNHLEWIKKDLAKLGKRYGFQFTYHSYGQDLRRNDSIRGAELLHSQYGRLYQHRVNVATKTVLQTQQDCCYHGTCTTKDDAYELGCHKIAEVYAQLTKVTQQEAYARAHTDMKVAGDMYRLMDQDAKEIKPIHLTTTHKIKDDPTTTASISSPLPPLKPPVLDAQQEQARPPVPSPTQKSQQRGVRPSPHAASASASSATTSCCVVM